MSKWTTADITDQTGRTAVITGANTGLGYETASALAAKGADVVLAVRNLEKGKAAADLITRTPRRRRRRTGTRLASLESIRTAADELRAKYDSIDLLINNAGVMFTPKRRPRTASNCSSAPTTSATSRSPVCCSTACWPRRFARGDGQQHRSPLRGRGSASTTCSGSAATTGSAPTGSPSWPT